MVANRFNRPLTLVLAFAFFSISAVSSPALAADLYYYDGTVKRKLAIDTAASEKSAASNQRIDKSVGKPTGKSTDDSPVFRTISVGATGAANGVANGVATGPAMVLPGGVILVPKEASNEAKLMASLQAKGLEVERPIGNSGAYLIRSKQGMAALELANKLHESGEFESVSPNWKRERTKK